MRIDKYLWATRYFKTRSIGSNACKNGKIHINDQPAKPAKEVYPGDRVRVRIDQINYEIEVLDLPKSRVGAKLVDQYRKDHTPKEAFEHREFAKLSQEYYRQKGEGRPTKKDRRSLEAYTSESE
ncbi:MAG: RNA-binding S4 domain-containing protein [Flavobacteriaceae bacterium]